MTDIGPCCSVLSENSISLVYFTYSSYFYAIVMTQKMPIKTYLFIPMSRNRTSFQISASISCGKYVSICFLKNRSETSLVEPHQRNFTCTL